ncbi:MAG: GNAT family N-acetyltransferase [Rhodospirillaceae bacterium]|nr:GNAT family N-acetyltransferase [Rhodospirillaceae bacterium]
MAPLNIRQFGEDDARDVVVLFTMVNRLLAPDTMKEAFEHYIQNSIDDEMGRIAEYYAEKGGGFWVAEADGELIGMFGLEPSGTDAMELRRMYVHPDWRRQGIANTMLRTAEDLCRSEGCKRLDLSTSEVQPDALAFYRAAGYAQTRDEVADAATNKTIGGGIRRYHFEKTL